MTTHLWQRTAGELARMIASRQVTSAEVVEAHLARIAVINPKVNAIVRVLADEARAGDALADQAVARGDALGPLHGVPCTVKENIELAARHHAQPLERAANGGGVERWRGSGAGHRDEPDRPRQRHR